MTTYRAKPITQRDGSKLANSNCRMSSIACGLDFDTLGAKTSSGAKMRAAQGDQSGGTDSADAREAWLRGYDETLVVRDGRTWGQALDDLRAGRLVHIDVWHAAVSVCVSGTGQYGHTMAIAPEQAADGKWLVSDPWCLPPRWAWVSERSLREGAEAWGRKVFSTGGEEADWPTGGGWPREEDPDDVRWAILRRVVRALMTRYHAGGDDDPEPPPADTGGPQKILFTVTAAHPPEEVETVLKYRFLNSVAPHGTVMTAVDGAALVTLDGRYVATPKGEVHECFGPVELLEPLDDHPGDRQTSWLVGRRVPDEPENSQSAILLEYAGTFTPDDPGTGDCSDAVAKRDIEWEDWLLAGAPGNGT